MNLEDIDIIICPNDQKKKILNKLSNQDKLFNIKFFTKKEFINNYYFSYNDKTIYYLMNKYNLNIDVVKVYLNNLYFIDINKNYNSSKLEYLKSIKKELLDNNLLLENKYFKKYLKNKNIKVLNYYDLDKYEEKALNTKLEFNNINYSNDVYEFNSLEEEIVFICTKIINLLHEKVNINKIFITGANSDYYYTIKRIFNYFNIPINIDNKSKIYGTKLVQDFINTNKLDLSNESNLELNKKLLSIKNSLVDIEDNSNEYKEILINKIKSMSINKVELDNAVNIINIYERDIEDDEYLFVLGFNMDVFPSIDKDIDYISDNEKDEIDLYKTTYKNIRRKKALINILSKIKNVTLSYHLTSSFTDYYPSPLIDEYNFNVIKNYEIPNTYSNFYNQLKLTKYLDLYTVYNEEDTSLRQLLTHYNIPYKMYSNKYTLIDDFTKNVKLPLSFSYSSLNNYNECHFKYYLTKILKIDNYESNFAAFIGTMYHDILTHVFEDNFDFESTYNDYLKDKELSNKEKLLLVRIKEELKELIDIEKKQYNITNYKDSYYEKELRIDYNKKVDAYFHGFIDRILYQEDSKFNYAILDYKSGTIDTDIKPMKYGLHLQLPSYLYLVEKSNEFNNPTFTGIYYQNILFDRNTWSLKENNYDEIIKENTMYVGYSTDDTERLSSFDPTYQKSDLIKSMAYTDKFNQYAKTLSDYQVNQMINYTEKTISKSIDNIIDRDFTINPKIYKKNNISCKYCKFNDICFKTNDDIEYLDTVENLDFLGGDE